MARDAAVEARLLRWAAAVTVGDGSGFPVMSVLHREWMPPSPGVTPTLKTSSATDARATHRAIAKLGQRKQNTVVRHYCHKMSVADHAAVEGVEPQTVHARIVAVHAELRRLLFDEDQEEFCRKDS